MTSIDQAARALVANQAQCDCYDDLEPEAQERARETVRAVLGAIREPTTAMIVAGDDLLGACHGQREPADAIDVWATMIDAALTEATQERTG